MNGFGVQTWPDGRRYEGQFESDNKQGKGRQSWPDGRWYDGYWHRGSQHGDGSLYDPKSGVAK